MRTDVIVIGGGISGLVTALACVQRGLRVILLEKNMRLGGRLHTIYHGAFQYEAGAGRVSSFHSRTLSLLKAFGLTLVPIKGNKEYRYDGGRVPNPVFTLVKRVLRAAKGLTQDQLLQHTFGAFCQNILGEERTRDLIAAFGYDAEFHLINAWDGLQMFQKDFGSKHRYFVVGEGFTELVHRIERVLLHSNLVSILKGHTVTSWKDSPHGFHVYCSTMDGTSSRISGHAVVCSIPKDDLQRMNIKWTREQTGLLNSVTEVPLHRIYGRFPTPNGKSWFHDIPITTTNNPIRQFIPVDRTNGVAMISYSDSDYAKHWNTMQGNNTLRKELLKNLQVVFPEVTNIPKPLLLESFYWPNGVHMWKPGYHSQQVHEKLLQPFGESRPWFLVGESFSIHQAWVEGCLETIEEVLPKLFGFVSPFKARAQSGGNIDMNALKERHAKIKWVILQDPRDGRKRVLDVTKWMNLHPGGASPFMDHLYQDITPYFNAIPYHKEGGHIKDRILSLIDMYTVEKL